MEKKTESSHPSSKFDRLSDLPCHVLDDILVRLPLRTAVRTSILSKSWRHKWETLSSLEFSLLDFCNQSPESEEEEAALTKMMTNVIYEVLSRHHDQIDKFKISTFFKVNSYDVDQWLLFLSTKNIKEINLSVSYDIENNYKLHSCVFSCQRLDRLELFHCILELPITFKGFNNLRSLVLKFISTRDEDLGSLIQGCPVLEKLDLVCIEGLSSLKIHAPKLKSLNIDCSFDDISIESCHVLEVVSICYSNDASDELLKQRRMVSNLVRVLGGLSRLKRLLICGRFAEYLSIGGVPEKFPISYNHLKKLSLSDLSFNNLEQILVAFSILRSSPSLESLHFWDINYNLPNDMKLQAILKFMEAQRQSNISFTQLRFVGICFLGLRTEIEFVKLLLACSPVLEKMVIYNNGGTSNENIREELLESERASARAEVNYTTHEG